MNRRRPVFLTLTAALAALALCACGADAPAPGMTVLTVAGAIEEPNRGAFDANSDRYFGWLGVDFPTARGFARRELDRLPQHQLHAVRADAAPPGAYEGPLLTDVLDLAGVDDDARILAYALDGYTASIPLRDARAAGAIVALSRDGMPLPLGGMGPAILVFPDESRADPGWYVWGLVLISVE